MDIKTIDKDRAFPQNSGRLNSLGLTKLEYFAAIAMQGLLSNSYGNPISKERCAKEALSQAKALIEELNK